MSIQYLKKIISIFPKNYKKNFFIISLMSIIAGFFEFFGIALIFPLILIILNPEATNEIPYLTKYLNNIDTQKYSLIFSFSIISIFILKNIFMIFNNYIQASVLKKSQNGFNLKIMKTYLFSNYENNIKIPQKYSLLNMFQIIQLFFSNYLHRCITLFSNFIIFTIIIIFLIWKFQLWVLYAGTFFIISGFLQNIYFKNKVTKLVSQKINIINNINNSILIAIKNIKDIKIAAKENHFYKKYKKESHKHTQIDILLSFFESIPQNIIEICIIFSIIIMAYGIFVVSKGNAQTVIANLGMLAAAMFRLAPVINKIQLHSNILNANKPIAKELIDAYDFYKQLEINYEITDEKIQLQKNIQIKNLCFSYDNKNILSNININIKKGEFIGIIGASGVGKTTFVDILMGLLSSNNGEIIIDETILNKTNTKKWLNSIGYVPQDITIIPTTIAENIAIGEEEQDINYSLIDKIIKIAQIKDYIDSLPNGIKTPLSGNNLSQGQKQRIGIARALYKNPDILFLDEITSALDVETEHKIIKSLEQLKGKKTIIAIAHRLSTLKNCDRIFYFKSNDEIICGTTEELLKNDETFKNIVDLASFK